MRRMFRLALVVALVTTACRAEINLALSLEEDGSGEFAAELGFDEEFQQLLELGAEGQDLSASIFEGFNVDIPGATTEEVVRGDMTFFVAKAPFENITEFDSDILGSADADNPFQDFSIVVDDGGAAVDANLTIPDATEGAGDLGELPFDPSTFTDDIFSFNFILSMPGEVTSHNASEVLSDGRLRWSIPITGGDVSIMAESSFGGAAFPIWLIALLAVVVIGIGLGIWLSRRNRQRSVDAIAAAGAGGPSQEGSEGAPSGDIFASPADRAVAGAAGTSSAAAAAAVGLPPEPPTMPSEPPASMQASEPSPPPEAAPTPEPSEVRDAAPTPEPSEVRDTAPTPEAGGAQVEPASRPGEPGSADEAPRTIEFEQGGDDEPRA